MFWGITKDHTGQGTEGTKNWRMPGIGAIETLPCPFRILDEDRNVLYEGRASDNDTLDVYYPLDWAQFRSGATKIQYQRNGEWQAV